MAIAASLIVAMGLDSAQLTRGLRTVNNQINRFNRDVNRSLRNVTTQFTTFRNELALVGAATGLALGSIIQTTARFEDLRTSLASVTGSAQAGADAFSFISDFATRTQFSVEELSTAFIQLRSAGIEPTEDLLTLFTDTAAVTTDQLGSLQAITALFSRTTAGGLGLEELNRLADRGIPVFDILNDTLGISRLEVSRLGQSAEGAQLILGALSEGLREQFGGATQARLGNLSTTISNLGISFRNLQDSVGQLLIPAFQELLQEITNLTMGNDMFIQQIATAGAAAIRGFTNVIRFLANNFDRVVTSIRTIFTAWVALRTAMLSQAVVTAIVTVTTSFITLARALRTTAGAAAVVQAITGVGLVRALAGVAAAAGAVVAVNSALSDSFESLEDDVSVSVGSIDAFTTATEETVVATGNWMEQLETLNGDGPASLTSFQRTLENAMDTTSRLSELGSRAFDGFSDSLTDFVFTGMANFRDFAQSIIRDLIRIQIRAQLVQLFSAASGGGGLFAGFFQNGGFIPRGQFGIVGEAGPEIVRGPAEVTSASGTEEILSGAGGGNITINVSAIDASSFTDTVTQPRFREAIAAAMDLNNRDRGIT